MVDDTDIVIIRQIPFIDNKGSLSILRNVRGQERSLAHFVPTSTVFSTHGMTFKQDGILVSQFNAVNVNGISGDCNAIPSTTHGTIGRTKGLAQTKLFDLKI
jgi:hypothetical protein